MMIRENGKRLRQSIQVDMPFEEGINDSQHRGPTIAFCGTTKKIGQPVVTYAATEIFGTPNKSLRNEVQYLFSHCKRGYAIFNK